MDRKDDRVSADSEDERVVSARMTEAGVLAGIVVRDVLQIPSDALALWEQNVREHASRTHALGPIIDPSSYRGDARRVDALARVARALVEFQRVCIESKAD